ncbi:ABC transporter permease [Marinicella litoralis]|uniref:ABC-2 family transporter n=1 Tax=Marinicella litoralis TaxID=644220 RepID=A0A4R6XPT8_9GAMM|nr:ABC transporter permease [Marinicella litoralis]TDR20419.1 ABC-2 family transporter [Marinicella litoralis]
MKFNHMPMTVAGLRVKRVIREKWGFIQWLAIPIIIVFLMSLIAGTGSGKLTGRLLITDHDDSTISQFLTGSFSQGPLAEMFTVKQVTEAEGTEIMDAGDASAWITINQGFGDAFLNNETTQLTLVKNPAQTILPQMVETSMKLLVDAASYMQIIFEKELAVLQPMLANQKFNDTELVILTLGIKQQIERLEETMFPPQLTLIKQLVESPDEEKQNITFGLLMFPGAIFMALIFSANSLAVSIWDDASNGVIPRLSSTPAALGAYINGQVLAAGLIFALISIVLGCIGGWYFALPMGQLPVLLLWLVFSGLVIYMLFVTISLLMPSSKVANITVNATTFPLLMVGGSFFPMESMPPWLAAVGQFLPNGFLLKGLKDWLVRQEPMADAMLIPLILGAVMLLLLWILNRYLIKQLIQKV